MSNIVNLPEHVGIIMDGNGRWAKERGKDRSFGHKEGASNVDTIVTHAFSKGVKALTLYAFSSENWQRPKKEVDELMRLIKVYFQKYVKKLLKNNVRLIVVGDLSALTPELRKIINKDMEDSKDCTDHILNVAINYGARQEIVNSVKTLIENGEEITVDNVSKNLYTALSGEPDLIIRTGGEYRLSNFLLYQGAYAELYFTPVYWPDFTPQEFDKAMESFQERNRRYGGV